MKLHLLPTRPLRVLCSQAAYSERVTLVVSPTIGRMPYMYILECSDRTLYVGSARDLDVRLGQHEVGEGARYTRTRLPVRLVYFEQYDRVEDAFRREKQVQGWSRSKRLALVHDQLELLPELSRKRFDPLIE